MGVGVAGALAPEEPPAALGTILVVDEHPLLRRGIVQLLTADASLQLVGDTGSSCEALALARDFQPDLTLLGLSMKRGTEILAALKADDPARRVVVLTGADATEELMEAIRAGANGYLSTDIEPEVLLAQVKSAVQGHTVVCDSLAGALAVALRDELSPDQRSLSELTEREQDVLRCVASGMSNKMIAQQLAITDGTVKVHIKHMLRKLGFRSRLEAAVWAVKRGHKPA